MVYRTLQETAVRYFFEVVRCGSISEAAQKLHVAPSAISRQIAGLEQSLDTVLFERHARGMIPTAAGEILAAHARRAQLESEKTMQDIRALRGLRSGKVRIVGSEGFITGFLPPLIVRFQEQHDGIAFELDAAAPISVSASVRDGSADIGIKFSQTPDKDIRVEYRKPAPVLALLHPAHPLARESALTLQQMSRHAVALPSSETTVRQMLEVACSAQQIALNPVFTSNNMVALHNFVLHGGGIAVSGEVSVRELVRTGRLVAIAILDPFMEMRHVEVQTLAGRQLPLAVKAFLDMLIAALD